MADAGGLARLLMGGEDQAGTSTVAQRLARALYPQGWQGGLLGYGNAAADQVRIDQERAGLLSQGLPGQAIMHKPMDNPMGFAMGTSNVGKPIKAFHGSPHDFDAFDMSKIGTGEGAQAYGHGLYFAENEGVARGYRDALSGPRQGSRGRTTVYTSGGKEIPVANKSAADIAQMMQQYKIYPRTKEGAEWLTAEIGARGLYGDVIRPQIDEFMRAPIDRQHLDGRMYEVNLHADPNKFLDWDKPLSGQGADVRGALEQFGFKAQPEQMRQFDDALLAALDGTGPTKLPKQPPDPLGANIYESSKIVPGMYRDKVGAANNLRDAGIPGIKYLDAGSRGAGDGTRNFVVFDPKIIEIVRKYGLGALGLTGLLGAQEDQGQ